MKKNILKYFLIIVFTLSVVFLIYPGLILGDISKPGKSSQVVNVAVNRTLTGEIYLSKFDNSFLPILVTSIIIVGILLFAIWQLFRSKRQL